MLNFPVLQEASADSGSNRKQQYRFPSFCGTEIVFAKSGAIHIIFHLTRKGKRFFYRLLPLHSLVLRNLRAGMQNRSFLLIYNSRRRNTNPGKRCGMLLQGLPKQRFHSLHNMRTALLRFGRHLSMGKNAPVFSKNRIFCTGSADIYGKIGLFQAFLPPVLFLNRIL